MRVGRCEDINLLKQMLVHFLHQSACGCRFTNWSVLELSLLLRKFRFFRILFMESCSFSLLFFAFLCLSISAQILS